MAASLAALIRGRDVFEEVDSLRLIAADQLDISAFAFESVIETLEEARLIRNVVRKGRTTASFTEHVPFYSGLYETLGENWASGTPSEMEQQIVRLVDALARSPRERSEVLRELNINTKDVRPILELAAETGLITNLDLPGGQILYSPFHGFEHPQDLAQIITDHGASELSDAFGAVREQQGLPVSIGGEVVRDAVAHGLLLAPSVERPNGTLEAFATLPYSIDERLLREQKPVLDKALAVIACLRMGQHFGGFSNLTAPALVSAINKLLREGQLNPHSSSERQYRLLNRSGVVQLAPDTRPNGRWKTPTLIDTEDNRAALLLAKDLITHGEQVEGRMLSAADSSRLLVGQERLGGPLTTIATMKRKKMVASDDIFRSAVDTLMGHRTR